MEEFQKHEKSGTLDNLMSKKRQQKSIKLDKAYKEVTHNQTKKRKLNGEN